MNKNTLNIIELYGRGIIILGVIFTYANTKIRPSLYVLICIILFLWTSIPFYLFYSNKKDGVKE